MNARSRSAPISLHLVLGALFVGLWSLYEFHMFVSPFRHEVLGHDAQFITNVALGPLYLVSAAASGHWQGLVLAAAFATSIAGSWCAAARWPASPSLRGLACLIIVGWWVFIDIAAGLSA
jgi:hypothetical protein